MEDFKLLKTTINTFREQGKTRFILDCARLTFISSEGLGLLVKVFKEQKEYGGQLIIFRPRENVNDIMRLSGLYDVMTIIDDDIQLENLLKSF
jgi:anti-anti-sigma factor